MTPAFVTAALVVTLVGCGRLGFAEQPGTPDAAASDAGPPDAADAPVADAAGSDPDDEDADGVRDSEDGCPFLPDATQADGDADGVGDACDPEPTRARQRWRFFTSLRPGSPQFAAPRTGWTVDDGVWHFAMLDGRGAIVRDDPSVDVDIWLGIHPRDQMGTGSQVALVIEDSASTPHFYGELHGSATNAKVAIVGFDGTDNTVLDRVAVTGGYPLTRGSLHLSARSNPPTMSMEADFGGQMYRSTASTPGYTGARYMTLTTANIVVDLHYVAIIETLP